MTYMGQKKKHFWGDRLNLDLSSSSVEASQVEDQLQYNLMRL